MAKFACRLLLVWIGYIDLLLSLVLRLAKLLNNQQAKLLLRARALNKLAKM